MSSIGISGVLLSLLILVIPIVLFILLLIWIYQIKSNSDVQLKQNQRIIELLEEWNRKSS
jgi:chromate transport protein ChrA